MVNNSLLNSVSNLQLYDPHSQVTDEAIQRRRAIGEVLFRRVLVAQTVDLISDYAEALDLDEWQPLLPDGRTVPYPDYREKAIAAMTQFHARHFSIIEICWRKNNQVSSSFCDGDQGYEVICNHFHQQPSKGGMPSLRTIHAIYGYVMNGMTSRFICHEHIENPTGFDEIEMRLAVFRKPVVSMGRGANYFKLHRIYGRQFLEKGNYRAASDHFRIALSIYSQIDQNTSEVSSDDAREVCDLLAQSEVYLKKYHLSAVVSSAVVSSYL